jgi:hypothetical protein
VAISALILGFHLMGKFIKNSHRDGNILSRIYCHMPIIPTIRRSDQILVVEGGRIVERGAHAELYAGRGRYWELYTRQHGIESNLFMPEAEPEPEAAQPRAFAEATLQGTLRL